MNDGGWHFTNIKSPKDLLQKMQNFGHHDEFDASGLTQDDLEKKIESKKVFYNHLVDKSEVDKWTFDYELKKINDELLPNYLIENKNNYKKWFDL